MVCLILHQRYEKRYAQYESLLNLEDPDEVEVLANSANGDSISRDTSVTSSVDSPIKNICMLDLI